MIAADDPRPLIAHVVYRFDVGGLENGLANLINHMPTGAYRHAVIALTEVTGFRRRITRRDVEFISLDKAPGHGVALYPKLHRLFRALRPDIVHTRNLAALEVTVPACTAGVSVRIHGEHGRDVGDYDGSSRKYQWVRRIYRPFVTHYVALSRDLEDYLHTRVGVPRARITQIYNGVDLDRFPATPGERMPASGDPFTGTDVWRVGTIGRLQQVKDPLNLARAFIRALDLAPSARDRLRLILVGDGPLRAEVQALLTEAGVAQFAWMPGERDDIPAILGSLDCFVLPSRAEGISNTILEAMASGVPVVATDVGGNAELVSDGVTGTLVPSAEPDALAKQMVRFGNDPERARRVGRAGRARAVEKFSLDTMVQRYQALYDKLLSTTRVPALSGDRVGL